MRQFLGQLFDQSVDQDLILFRVPLLRSRNEDFKVTSNMRYRVNFMLVMCASVSDDLFR